MMTWHLGPPRIEVAVVLAALIAVGCGTSADRRARIRLVAPDDKAELTIADDIDPATPGVQVEVRAQTTSIRGGTPMLLVIAGEAATYFSKVDDRGSVVFETPTLPPGPHMYSINTATGAVGSDEYSYTLKTLVIESPRDGQGIAFGDDIDQEAEGLQINVTIKAYSVDGADDIALSIDDEIVGSPVSPDVHGVAVFKGVTFASGTHTLKAVAGNVQSSETTISVNPACASVTWINPRIPNADRLTLGGGDSCPLGSSDFTVDVEISTDAGDGREVELVVNTTTKRSSKVQGSVAVFEDVPLNQRMSPNKLSVTVQGASGVTCAPVPFPKDVFVDCLGSDCSIGFPVPYSGKSASGEPTFYLNRSMLNGGGFDFRVDSDSGVLGRQVQLIIDERDGSALSKEGEPAGNKVSANFDDVQLSAGPHTIEARCRDASGNVTRSGKSTWVVDTEGCRIAITKPQEDSVFLPGDDSDQDLDNGIQIATVVSVTGGDCVGARAAICDPDEGIPGTTFAALDGDELRTDVKLETDAEQTLCVEARDRADNLSHASVPLSFRAVLPNVRIESPADQSSFNAAGNDGRQMDSNSATPACDADFRVLCSELGALLQLHRDDEDGPVLATGTCEPRADGDPELPEGYRGRAKLDDVTFLAAAKHEGTLVATQMVQGSSQTLLGVSQPITLTGWCEAPPITLYPGCPAEQIELPVSGNVMVSSLSAIFIGEVVAEAPMEATLTVTGAGGTQISSKTATRAGDRYVFTGISLGNTEQTVETKVALTDGFANTTTVTCATTLVSDLPTLRITSPAFGAYLGPASGCDPGVANKYGVPVALALDQSAMRELSYSLNSGSPVDMPIGSTSVTACIPVDDGANTLSFQLKSTSTVGVAKATASVTVNVLEITTPSPNATLVAADDVCDPGFGAEVVAEVAPAFDGSAATVSVGSTQVTAAVSGGEIDACLALPVGGSTLTVSLDGKSISRSTNVTVATGSPSSPIALTTVTQPPAASYRSGSVTLGWSAPSEDYPGQLKAYELRCGATAIAASASQTDKDNWWNAAKPVALVGNVVPPATSAAVNVRIGETRHCVLRGKDGANQLSPIPDSTQVSHPFREQQVGVSDLNRMGYALAAVGDVNDDGVGDVLVGGTGRAYLYFGNSAGLDAKPNESAPDVTFRGAPGIAEYDFGSRVSALGDLNGDGENDFAISHPTWSATSPSVVQTGSAYVFYGRKSGDAWPSSIDLTSSNPSSCGADACFYGEVPNEFLGFALAPAGDFNNDGRPDIALSAASRAIPSDSFAGRQYVLLGRAFQGSGGSRPGAFWSVAVRLPSSDPPGFYVDGVGSTGSDATSSSQMGIAAAAVGNVDGVAGGDLLVGSLGRSSPSVSAKLYFLSGRGHNGSAPQLKQIDHSQLVFKAGGMLNSFGIRLAPLRNFYDDSQSGVVDVAVFESTGDTFYIYLGDLNGSSERFANDTRLTVQGPSGSLFGDAGLGASRGYNPNIGSASRSDLDGDGLDDLCIGAGNGARPISIFYGADVDEALSGNQLNASAASQVQLAARPGTGARSVQPVGDITGDGAVDLVVGDPDANSNAGGITVLY